VTFFKSVSKSDISWLLLITRNEASRLLLNFPRCGKSALRHTAMTALPVRLDYAS